MYGFLLPPDIKRLNTVQLIFQLQYTVTLNPHVSSFNRDMQLFEMLVSSSGSFGFCETFD